MPCAVEAKVHVVDHHIQRCALSGDALASLLNLLSVGPAGYSPVDNSIAGSSDNSIAGALVDDPTEVDNESPNKRQVRWSEKDTTMTPPEEKTKKIKITEKIPTRSVFPRLRIRSSKKSRPISA